MKEQMKFDWCLQALRKSLLATDWGFEMQEETSTNTPPSSWSIKKDHQTTQVKFYWNIYQDIVYSGACQIMGTSIALDFLEFYQKDAWLKSLKHLIEKLNNNCHLIDFGGHLLKELSAEEAIEIAQEYIDKRTGINAKITGQTQFMSAWYTHKHLVWIVYADNLYKGPIIDGTSSYSIIVSFKTREVEKIVLM